MSAASVPKPVLLSLDTATDRLHAALSVGEDVHTRDLPGGAQASSTLLPMLAELLREAGLAWADVDAIAFGSGPGAFTGLRTACSVAQGLALALGRPVIALDTLMAVAEDARQASPAALSPGDVLWVLQDARMAELYTAAFAWDGHGWHATEPARLWPLGEPAERWGAETPGDAPAPRWAGNAGVAYPVELAAILPACLPGPSGSGDASRSDPAAPRGAALAALARAAWACGDTLDAALALPRYVRDKVAQTTAERSAGRTMARSVNGDVAENGSPP